MMGLFGKDIVFGREELPWPADADGKPEKAQILCSLPDTDSSASVLCSFLFACDIPCRQTYGKDGGAGKVVLGFSGYGVDVLVPESRLEEAKALLEAQPIENNENNEEENDHV